MTNVTKTYKIIFFVVFALFLIIRATYYCFPDNDLWARLLVGSSLIDGGGILKHDIYSYTPTHIWYDHEWGASFFIYLFFKLFHEWGLILLKILLLLSTMFFVFKTIELKKPKSTTPYNIIYYVAAFFAAYYVLGGTVRCHLFTFLFLTIFYYILEKIRLGKTDKWWILPLIMLFWGNIHGGCVSGVGILLIYTIGEALNKKPVKPYLYAFLLSSCALFINPWGIGYVVFLLKATTMKRGLILEWLGTFHPTMHASYKYFKAYMFTMLFFGVASMIKNRITYTKADKTKILLILTTLYLSIAHIKHQPFFVLTAAIFLYDDVYSVFNSFMAFFRSKMPFISDDVAKKIVLIKEIIVYICIILFSAALLSVFRYPVSITVTSYPYYAIEFIKLNNIQGKLFINFDWGSYAAYKLFPHNSIAIDGRYEEVYNTKLIDVMGNFHLLKNDKWYDIIEKYPPDVMVIEKKFPAFEKINKNDKWSLVFDNNLSGVFVPVDKKKESYKYPTLNKDYYEKTKFDKMFSFIRTKKE